MEEETPSLVTNNSMIHYQNMIVAMAYTVRKSQMMKGSLWRSTRPYFNMAVSAVTDMESCTKPVMNQATQCTALFKPIIFIT